MAKGRSKTALTTLKIAVFAPIPSPKVSTATRVNAGVLRKIRIPYRKSCSNVRMKSP
jgi:hypothetical protein